MTDNFNELPDRSRVWIYQSNRKLTGKEAQDIRRQGLQFIKDWAAHGKGLSASFDVLHRCFLVLFADEQSVVASGCSIDSSVQFIKKIEKEYDLDLFQRTNIAYKDEKGEIRVASFRHFSKLLEQGKVNENTMVFNNLIGTKKELQEKWEVPVKESWIMQRM